MSDAGKNVPTSLPADPFANAKANLRDTIKWLATTLAGTTAVVIAGASLTGVSALSGWSMLLAVAGCGVGVLCTLSAIGVVLNLLTSESYTFNDLLKNQRIVDYIDEHINDLISPNFQSLSELASRRDEIRKEIQSLSQGKDLNRYNEVAVYFSQIELEVNRVVQFSHFEELRWNFKKVQPLLFVLALVAISGFGVFTVFGGHKTGGSSENSFLPAAFSAESDFAKIASYLQSYCGKDLEISINGATAVPKGYVRLRLSPSPSCDGIEIVLPAELLVVPKLQKHQK